MAAARRSRQRPDRDARLAFGGDADRASIAAGGARGIRREAPGADRRDRSRASRAPRGLRRDRERLGAVNLRAEEELREVEAQYSSLAAERDDLGEAIKRLRQGIQNLNREARERLTASFEVVNRHFQELFANLFGGGTAE